MATTMVTDAEAAADPESPTQFTRRLRNMLLLRAKTRAALGYGAISGTLYYLLYYYSGDIRQIAEMTHQGDKTYFLFPIGIAFVFSVFHGLFTDRFWEALGITAKR